MASREEFRSKNRNTLEDIAYYKACLEFIITQIQQRKLLLQLLEVKGQTNFSATSINPFGYHIDQLVAEIAFSLQDMQLCQENLSRILKTGYIKQLPTYIFDVRDMCTNLFLDPIQI